MHPVAVDSPGETLLLIGNEAIARGALEAGLGFAAAYPGNPSSEILETLASVAKDVGIYTEWSVNEKVALESASAASFAGLRAMASMKQNGVNVAADYLSSLALSGIKGGMILVTCDDPGSVSSINEEDSRTFARLMELPLLEPSHPQEALEMAKFAFDLAETLGVLVILRSVSRLSHTRSNVKIGPLPESKPAPHLDTSVSYNTVPVIPKHQAALKKLETAREMYEKSPFNSYEGPDAPELLVVSCGVASLYAREAVQILGLEDRVGVAKIGTMWPLPGKWVAEQLKRSERILFVEEVQPFLEDNVKNLYAQNVREIGFRTFYGKDSGHMPNAGELSPDVVAEKMAPILGVEYAPPEKEYAEKAQKSVEELVPYRGVGFCPGCPHRATFWSIKNALKWDDREGFVPGDIGCYSMAVWPTGFNQLKTLHAMGSGVGQASGFGKLDELGFTQPIISVVGDSTFFHAGLPPLVNAVYNKANFLLIVLDNSATAMTGFQPHPGTGFSASGELAQVVDIEAVCRSVGAKVEVVDPYDLKTSTETIYRLLQEDEGVRVLIMRRKCALVQRREGGFPYRMEIDPEKCRGEDCGCDRYCTRVFRCPGLIWDRETGKSSIDQVICVGCGVCADICPEGAIVREKVENAA